MDEAPDLSVLLPRSRPSSWTPPRGPVSTGPSGYCPLPGGPTLLLTTHQVSIRATQRAEEAEYKVHLVIKCNKSPRDWTTGPQVHTGTCGDKAEVRATGRFQCGHTRGRFGWLAGEAVGSFHTRSRVGRGRCGWRRLRDLAGVFLRLPSASMRCLGCLG